jgi:hypothetical protein
MPRDVIPPKLLKPLNGSKWETSTSEVVGNEAARGNLVGRGVAADYDNYAIESMQLRAIKSNGAGSGIRTHVSFWDMGLAIPRPTRLPLALFF